MTRSSTLLAAVAALGLAGASLGASAGAASADPHWHHGYSGHYDHYDRGGNPLVPFIAGAVIGGIVMNGINTRPAYDQVPPEQYYRDARVVTVPASCSVDIQTRDGYRRGYYQSCLEHAGLRVPAQCAFDLRTRSGWHTVMTRDCMSDAGIRFRDY